MVQLIPRVTDGRHGGRIGNGFAGASSAAPPLTGNLARRDSDHT